MKKIAEVMIVGGGFGGFYAARALVRAGLSVTLFNDTASFAFKPLLPEVAVAGLSTEAASLDYTMFSGQSNFKFIQARVDKIEPASNSVEAGGQIYHYDYLLIASGAVVNAPSQWTGETVWRFGTLTDAVAIRGEVERLLALAKPATAVIVGAGPTGVELAAELARWSQAVGGQLTVRLAYMGESVLANLPPALISYAEQILRSLKVEMLTDCKIDSVAGGVLCGSRGEFAADMVVLTVGVRPSSPAVVGIVKTERDELAVDQTLKLIGTDNVWVIGDAAKIGLTGVPKLAQTAVGQARVVAGNILRQINKQPAVDYRQHLTGVLCSLGRGQAVGEIFGVLVRGQAAWLLWRLVYWFKLPSWRQRWVLWREWSK